MTTHYKLISKKFLEDWLYTELTVSFQLPDDIKLAELIAHFRKVKGHDCSESLTKLFTKSYTASEGTIKAINDRMDQRFTEIRSLRGADRHSR